MFRQATCAFAGSRKQHDTGNGTVQSMDDADEYISRLLIFFTQVLSGDVDKRGFTCVVAHRQKPCRFLKGETMIVFVKNDGKPTHEIRQTLKAVRLG